MAATESPVVVEAQSGMNPLSHQSTDEERERATFMQDVHRFMVEIGRPLSKIPIMGYKELDLYQLFREVVARGGFNEVVRHVGTWSKIWKRLSNFDPSITDSSFRLKKNYERYLLEYEYACFPEHRKQAEAGAGAGADEDAERRQRRKKNRTNKQRAVLAAATSGGQAVPRTAEGQPMMPLVLDHGELTVHSLGTIVPRAPYLTDKHTWPIGYSASRMFVSWKSPSASQLVPYVCQVLDGGDRPQFVVTAGDDPAQPVMAQSPSAAWRAVLRRVQDALPKDVKETAVPKEEAEEASGLHQSLSTASLVSAAGATGPAGSVAPLVSSASAINLQTLLENESDTASSRADSPMPVAAEVSPLSALLMASQRVRGTLQFGLAHPLVQALVREMAASLKAEADEEADDAKEDSFDSAVAGLGALKRKASEMCLSELAGSDDEAAEAPSPRGRGRKAAREAAKRGRRAARAAAAALQADDAEENADVGEREQHAAVVEFVEAARVKRARSTTYPTLFTEREVRFESAAELDDFETAVATLQGMQALKFATSVY